MTRLHSRSRKRSREAGTGRNKPNYNDEDEFDDEFAEADEIILVGPECGSDDLEVTGQDLNGDDEYECLDCGETFGQEDLEEE